jgi:hypothetical protein
MTFSGHVEKARLYAEAMREYTRLAHELERRGVHGWTTQLRQAAMTLLRAEKALIDAGGLSGAVPGTTTGRPAATDHERSYGPHQGRGRKANKGG